MFKHYYDDDDNIVFSNHYCDELKSEDFDNLDLKEQNDILRKTIINLSSDFEKLISIIFDMQRNLDDTMQWADKDIKEVYRKLYFTNAKINEHINSMHAYLIIGKEK